jgi:hypothetical protein
MARFSVVYGGRWTALSPECVTASAVGGGGGLLDGDQVWWVGKQGGFVGFVVAAVAGCE